MRVVIALVVSAALLLSSGCSVWEKATTNRGGYLDYVVDDLWIKADSKGMRALRAFAIQVSLARIASVSAKNDSDRQLLAIRIGALTSRFLPIYACAFDTNPLAVAGGERDPCFYYDSAMVEYSTGLFDLAMIALPVDDAKNLVNSLTGSVVNPLNIADLLTTLFNIGRDALKYGRVVGALYRDSVELEVQLWLATPAIDDRPPPFRVTEEQVAALREIYSRRNDDMPAWLAQIAALRGQGFEPRPHYKFFGELSALMKYICNQITKDANAVAQCTTGLPLQPPTAVARALARTGNVATTVNLGRGAAAGGGTGGGAGSGAGGGAGAGAGPTKIGAERLMQARDIRSALAIVGCAGDDFGPAGSPARKALAKFLSDNERPPSETLTPSVFIDLRELRAAGKKGTCS